VEVGGLFIDKERVWHPNGLDVLRADDQLVQARPPVEGEARVLPELPEVHVQREVLAIAV